MNQFEETQFAIGLIKNYTRYQTYQQQGAALIVSLIILLLVSMLGISAAQLSIEESKAARNDIDRQVAFHAAEAALLDAELDIENSPDSAKSRSQLFSNKNIIGFPGDGEASCRSGRENPYLGLCRYATENGKSAWLTANLSGDATSAVNTVPFGTFTGRAFQVGKGSLSGRLPQYVIELMVYNQQGENADQVSYFYRVTAIGFGARDSTKVVLQTFYRKEG